MKEVTTLDKIKKLLGMETKVEVETKVGEIKLEQLALDNGTIVEADVFEANAEVFIVSEDERIPLPIGDYPLKDSDRIIVVAEAGIIAEMREAGAEQEEGAPAVAAEEVEAEEIPVKKIIESVSKETHFDKDYLEVELQKLRDELNEKFEALKPKTELEKVEEKVEPLKHSPEAEVETNQHQRFSQNRPMSTEDYVFQLLFNKN